MSLLAELQRRNVIRMAGLYLVVAWLVVQVVNTLLPIFEAPAWVSKTVVALLVIGFVPALVFAWVFELTPEGLKRDTDVRPGQSIASQTGRRMDRLIFAGVLALIALIAVDRLWPRGTGGPPRQSEAAAETAAPANGAAAPLPARKSIAVLPFVALSRGEDDAYFADGLTEEILNSLAQLPDLLVTARTSAFHFKDKDVPVPEVAKALGVAHVLEGSVRRSAARMRVTAQLIRAGDGFHLWSETYDRNVDDAIAVQDDIAQHVAASLEVLLDETRLEDMRKAAIGNVEAYVAYQKGLALYNQAHVSRESSDFFPRLREANLAFEAALARVPNVFTARLLTTDVHAHQFLDAAMYGDAPEVDAEEVQRISAALADGLARAQQSARNEDERASATVSRIYLSNDWSGLAAASAHQYRARTCVPTMFNDTWMTLGGASAAQAFYEVQNACNPLGGDDRWAWAQAMLWNGKPAELLATAGAGSELLAGDARLEWTALMALMGLGRFADAEAMVTTSTGSGHVGRAEYETVLAAGRGDRAAAQAANAARPTAGRSPRVDLMLAAWMGDRNAANAVAASMDRMPLGHVALAETARHCYCGAPFDLAAAPHLKARLDESGFAWPPAKPVATPLKDW